MSSCVCPVAGYCERRNAVIPPLHHAKCQAGDVAAIDAVYSEVSLVSVSLPGDVLQKMLKDRYGVQAGSCSCAAWTAKMNSWGPDGCEAHIDEIVDHLFDEASTNPQVSVAIRYALRIPVIGAIEGKRRLRAMVQEAIDRSRSTPTVRSSVEDIAKFFVKPVAAADLPAGWKNWPSVVKYHRELVQDAIRRSPQECCRKTRSGRGVIIPAGGVCRVYNRERPTSYFWQAYTAAWNLRYRGFYDAIEFWFLPGELEQIPNAERYAEGVGATCHVVDTTGLRVVGGWQIKIHAILQSNLRYVLHMDADNLVATDPTYLFDLVRDGIGTVHAHFWGDNPNLHDYRGYVEPSTWARLGSDRQTTDRDIETGQMVIDAERSAEALYVVKHLAEHADYWGGFNGGDPGLWYGDKTDFHVAFVLTNTPHFIDKRFHWNPGGFYRHYGPDGRLVFEHACHRKAEIVRGHTITNCHSNHAVMTAAALRPTALYPWKLAPRDIFGIINPKHGFVTDDLPEWQDDFARNAYGLPDDMRGKLVIDFEHKSFAFARACGCRGAKVMCGGYDPIGIQAQNCGINTQATNGDGRVVWYGGPDLARRATKCLKANEDGVNTASWIRCKSYHHFVTLLSEHPRLFEGCPEVVWDGIDGSPTGDGWRVEHHTKPKPFSRIVWVDSDSRID